MAIDATPGGASANSYITVADADLYFSSRLNSETWDDSPLQEEALIQSCLRLEQYDYVGVVVTETQVLKWPRMLNDDGDLIRNYAINLVPMPMKQAQCELALALLNTGGEAVAAGTVTSLQIGNSVKVGYATGSEAVVDTSVDFTGLPITVARYLKGLRLVNVLA